MPNDAIVHVVDDDLAVRRSLSFLLASDGLTECPDPAGTLLAEEGLAGLLARNRAVTGPALLEALNWDLSLYHGGDSFPDDLSMVLFDYLGPDTPPGPDTPA